MDKQEADFLLIEKTMEIRKNERDTKIGNGHVRIDEESNKRSMLKKIDRIIDDHKDRSKLSFEQVRKDIERTCGERFQRLPNFVQEALIFTHFPGDHGRPITEKPDWFDMEKFKKGQAFARDNFAGIFLAQLYGLFCLISHEDGLRTLIMTKKSHTPYLAFNRYVSTAERIRNWFSEDPWREGTKANRDIQAVRRMHLNVRRKLCELDHDEFDSISTIKNPHCPALQLIRKDFVVSSFSDTIDYSTVYSLLTANRPKSINQTDMSFTLFGFMGIIVLFPNEFGVYSESDEGLENFCHLWRSIAYLLGVEDDANFCRGSLEDVKRRSREYIDIVVKSDFQRIRPQWEHMSRCIINGFGYFFPVPSFEVTLLRVADLLSIEMPGLYASLSYWNRIRYIMNKFLFRYGLRFAFIRNIANKVVNKILDKTINLDKAERRKIEDKSSKSILHVSVGT
ncbi:hypothetical protein KPH14_005223 [Odynerus spinipes]|uniref:ER-bound oxygenase mpaB/mpaB'/Rubber oxygenase catalytic domain-containing protein n=1 Tax=Odynerus spinipes TaxID=1348599 RepID=A0AAD9RB89_9HYME|nr:hypothetical protein KPH14_005223 [Odynerus spinipes]